jgi:hypothetical protein
MQNVAENIDDKEKNLLTQQNLSLGLKHIAMSPEIRSRDLDFLFLAPSYPAAADARVL